MTALGTKIESWRRAAGLSQAKAGELIGVDQSSVARFERDMRIPDATSACKLIEAGAFTRDDWAAALLANPPSRNVQVAA